MEVNVAKTAGFCFGVKRAVEKANEVGRSRPGNRYIPMDLLFITRKWFEICKSVGVHVLETEEELKNLQKGTVIIRSVMVFLPVFMNY